MRFNRWAKLLQGLEKDLKFLAALLEIDAVQAGLWTADLSHSDRKPGRNAVLHPLWRNVKDAILGIEDDERATRQFWMITSSQGSSKVWDGTVENRHPTSLDL